MNEELAEQFPILHEIQCERARQNEKWGEQNHPLACRILLNRNLDGTFAKQRLCAEYEIPSANRAQQKTNIHAERGDLTYSHILIEEVSEAVEKAGSPHEMRAELIQVAAVAVAMIEAIDRGVYDD